MLTEKKIIGTKLIIVNYKEITAGYNVYTPHSIVEKLGEENIYKIGDITDNRYFRRDKPVKKWINEKLSTAHFLGLHKTKGKRLFDIGTGAGWFPYICNLYGHECIGSDIPNRPEYDPCYEFLNIDFRDTLVYPYTKMDLTGTFDYITTHRAFFPQRPAAWEKDEWKFFLEDAKTYLNDGGGLFLGCNSGGKLDPRYKKLPVEERSYWGNLELKFWFDDYVINDGSNGKLMKAATLYIAKEQIDLLLNT